MLKNTLDEMADHVELAASEIQALNKFPENSFLDFMKIVFDFICNSKNSEKSIKNLDDLCSSIGVSPTGVKNLVKSLICSLQNCVKQRLNQDAVYQHFITLGISEGKSDIIQQLWNQNLTVLFEGFNQMFMVNQLVDMEWKFGVTAATSDVNQVGQSFIQLKLITDKNNGKTESLGMELTLPQFYSFLHEMEKAKASLEYLL